MKRPSAAYDLALALTKKHHASSKTFSGRFLLRYLVAIKEVIDDLGCKTMLDYGAGKGQQYMTPIAGGRKIEDYLGVKVTKYDPAWPAFASEPVGKFDIVVCTQVLGSIPISDIEWVIDRMYGFARKAVFVGERLGPVNKQIHDRLRGSMPHEWKREDWEKVLHRPGSDIVAVLQTRDVRLQEGRHRVGRV